MEMDSVVATLEGSPITVEDIIIHLKANGTFRNAAYQIIESEVIKARCRERGIVIGEAELDEYARRRRNELGLDDAVKMNDYCRWLGIGFDQWSRRIENDLLRIKLANKVIDADAVTRHYEANKQALKTVSISRIVCRTEQDIGESKRMIDEQQRDFSTVAREVSIEESTRLSGGYIGTVHHGMLSPEVDRAVFAAAEHEILGPFRENGFWTLYHIANVSHAKLDTELRARISEQLFAAWLEAEVYQAEA